MAENAIRFGIAASSGKRSLSWKVWVDGNDGYLGSRGIAQAYKASFHESGQCQIGLSAEIRKGLVDDPAWKGKSRLFAKWQVRPELERRQHAKLFEVLFPFAHLSNLDRPVVDDELILEGKEGEIASVGLFRVSMPSGSVVESEDDSLIEIGRLPLRNGQCILVLYRSFQEANQDLQFFECAARSFKVMRGEESSGRGRTYVGGSFDLGSPNLRVMLYFKNNGDHYWVELSSERLTQEGN
jgi:hypothetical protein